MLKYLKAIRRITSFSLGRALRDAGHELEIKGSRLQENIAYLEPHSRHRNIMPLYNLTPSIASDTFIAPNSTIVGEVDIASDTSIWYGVVIRGDLNAVRIGSQTSIGDNTVIHTTTELPSGLPSSTNIGSGVTIQARCTLYSCTIDHQAFIGAGSTILEGVRIETGAVVGPNSVVPPGRVIPAHQIWAGNPVKYVRDVEKLEVEHLARLNSSLEEVREKHIQEFISHPTGYLQKENSYDDLNLKRSDMKDLGQFDHDQPNLYHRSDTGKYRVDEI